MISSRSALHCTQAAAIGAALLASAAFTHADWLAYRGPTGNGLSPDKIGVPQMPTEGPKVLWQAELGTGISAVTISNGKAYSMGNPRDKDVVYCFDAATGKEIWHYEFPLKLDANLFEGGPRSTPTLDGRNVYTVSHEGDLWCLDAATGKKLWYHHFQKEFGGRRPQWGYAGSPLVVGNQIVCDVGGPTASTIAFDRATGAVLWKAGGDQPGYSTPTFATLGGKPTILMLKADALVACDLHGSELWRLPWKTDYDVNAATPLVIGADKVLISSGYNAGCALLQVEGGKVKEVWRNKNLRAHINTPLAYGGFIYGMDGNANGGNLVCLDLATGDRKWQEKSIKGGSLIEAGGKLIVLSEKGELIICDASPDGFHALSRAPVLDKRCWVQPTFDAGKLYVKNNAGTVKCLALGGN